MKKKSYSYLVFGWSHKGDRKYSVQKLVIRIIYKVISGIMLRSLQKIRKLAIMINLVPTVIHYIHSVLSLCNISGNKGISILCKAKFSINLPCEQLRATPAHVFGTLIGYSCLIVSRNSIPEFWTNFLSALNTQEWLNMRL